MSDVHVGRTDRDEATGIQLNPDIFSGLSTLLWDSKWLIAGAMGLSMVISFLYTRMQPPRFVTSAKISFKRQTSSMPGGIVNQLNSFQSGSETSVIDNYMPVLQSRPFMQAVGASLLASQDFERLRFEAASLDLTPSEWIKWIAE